MGTAARDTLLLSWREAVGTAAGRPSVPSAPIRFDSTAYVISVLVQPTYIDTWGCFNFRWPSRGPACDRCVLPSESPRRLAAAARRLHPKSTSRLFGVRHDPRPKPHIFSTCSRRCTDWVLSGRSLCLAFYLRARSGAYQTASRF